MSCFAQLQLDLGFLQAYYLGLGSANTLHSLINAHRLRPLNKSQTPYRLPQMAIWAPNATAQILTYEVAKRVQTSTSSLWRVIRPSRRRLKPVKASFFLDPTGEITQIPGVYRLPQKPMKLSKRTSQLQENKAIFSVHLRRPQPNI